MLSSPSFLVERADQSKERTIVVVIPYPSKRDVVFVIVTVLLAIGVDDPVSQLIQLL
jgi:hypothetical protein